MTPALSWHRFGLEKLLRENRAQWLPWHEQVPYLVLDRSAHNLAAALAKWNAGTARFPRYRTKHGPGAGLAPVTFKEKDAAWLTGGGRALALPLSRANAGSSPPPPGLAACGWSKTAAAGDGPPRRRQARSGCAR